MNRITRGREASIADDLARSDSPDARTGGRFVGRVVSLGALPVGPGKFVMVNRVDVSGAECEGCSPTLTVDTSHAIPVALLTGSASVGDDLICYSVANRWVAEKATGSGPYGTTGHIPSCFCDPIPTPLTVTSSDHSIDFGTFQDATLAYGAAPSPFPGSGVPAMGFFSTASFVDGFSGESFYYWLNCSLNTFTLNVIFPDFGGSPLNAGSVYQWLLGPVDSSEGGPGTNTCSPFVLDFGRVPTGRGLGPVVMTIEG